MKKHPMFVSITVIVLLCIATIESCETPEGLTGVCIELTECPVLIRRILDNRSDPHLKYSSCGHAAGTVINIVAFENLF